MAFRGPALVVSAAMIAAGCSLLTSIPDVTSAANEPDSDAAADAHEDSPTSGADGSAAGFCAAHKPTSMFCDDFDDRTDLLARWDSVEGVGRIDGVAFRSPPNAFFAGPPAPGSCMYSVISKSWGPSYRASRLGFAVHADAPLPQGSVVAGQSLQVSDMRCQINFALNPPTVYEQIVTSSQQILNSNHDVPATIREGVWHDVAIDYDPDAKIVVTIDGEIVLSDPVAQSCPQGRGAWLTTLGWECVDNAPSNLSVHLDNVTFDPR